VGPAIALAGSLLALSCGGERSFDAEEIVAELSTAGTKLELGETLPSDQEGTEVRVVDFSGSSTSPRGDEATAGTVVILSDADAAAEEFARCQSAISFVCFRAANAVLRFTNIRPRQEAQVSASLEAIETSPDE
jgi:hypothetical protein